MNTIAILNDQFRNAGPGPGWVRTRGVAALSPVSQAHAVAAVCGFDSFDEDNDPYGEHDFGAFEIDGQKLFWKIDCYDSSDMTRGSEDPADPARTRRVLTIMLASEY